MSVHPSGLNRKSLDMLVEAISLGKIHPIARNLATGQNITIPSFDLAKLELWVADDIPESPVGFRSRVDGIIKWGVPLFSPMEIIRSWPARG